MPAQSSGMGVKEFFPNMYMVLTSMKNLNHAFKPPQATFRVQPRMTRTDVRRRRAPPRVASPRAAAARVPPTR